MLQFPGNERLEDSNDPESGLDARLLLSVSEGNHDSLSVLYKRRSRVIYSFLIRMLGNEAESQEVLQDTFLIIWKKASSFDPFRASPIAWMIMIARGRALDKLRARSRRESLQVQYEREVVSFDLEINSRQNVERDELCVACKTALQSLPEPQGHAIQLAFFRGWTHEEIAKASGEPLGTVKARIRRGLLALKKILKDYHA